MTNCALDVFASLFTPPAFETGAGLVARALPALTGSADAFLALSLTQGRVVFALTPGIPTAERLAADLRLLTGSPDCGETAYQTRILEFPPNFPGDKSALGLRLKTIAALRAWSLSPYPCVVVAPYPALAQPIPSSRVPPLRLAADGGDAAARLSFADLCRRLADLGYNRVPTVEREGDCAVRGGIVDVWSPGDEFPVRAEFFGDDLESVRTFDPSTQCSLTRISSAEILPAKDESDNAHSESILGLLPPGATLLALDHNEYALPDLGPHPAIRRVIYTGDPAPPGVATDDFLTVPLPGFAELGADEAHHPELFDAARKRLDQHLAAAECRATPVFRIDDLAGGFEITGSPGLVVVAKSDRVFAKRKVRARPTPAYQGARLDDFDSLEPGEYVVHVDYGVGRYVGSSEITVAGRRSEVFTIEYAEGAKLHVPATHAHLLSRYVGVKGEDVHLHRLDGTRWEKDKANAQKAVADLAAALLETQARREIVPGFAYDTACDGLDAFEAAFPYEETPDQAAAIAAIKADLAKRKPMDRLICGDAGYGKTEVAMRAAYIAALNGKQVAVLAPTTVLAEQHFETFTSRFDGTPVRIESVSRFQTSGTHHGTFERLANGACDIVIGTHAILSPKIRFHDLGLVIIDEEQRFGVRHKEFLKSLRATADILTLSATPIPRTLYLSMTGARDLSLLRSPPRERVAVETRIVRDSDATVSAAIEAEIRRGGQVYYLHNRVLSIAKVERRLRAICPKARLIVAHGQMDARTLAHKMRAFERGEADILLATTIIESGIDIPRANTILIDDADKFGMADLYQLRGRVGRSSKQGFAYFLLPASGDVDSDARERLSALKRHGGLGSGFNLAVRDLELRGAGNLLGSQQSGHIAAIGFSLYCQMLQRTVAALRGEKVRPIVDVRMNLDFIDASPASENAAATAALPYFYIEEDAQRMNFLRRFAEASDLKQVKGLLAEMTDRFGRPPEAARRLVRLAELRIACTAAGVTHVDTQGDRAVFYRNGSRDVAFVCDLKGANADRKIGELAAALRAHAT